MQKNNGVLSNIQILRAIAALNVVLFHSIEFSGRYGFHVDILAFLNGWGKSGVDLFFVISGFIMVHIQEGKSYRPGAFMLNRAVRIIPVYWTLTLLLMLIIECLPMAFSSAHPTYEQILLSFLFSSTFVLHQFPIVYAGWTLELEMVFYLIFALALFCRRANHAKLLAIFMIAAMSLLLKQTLLFEFAYGMVIGHICARNRFTEKTALIALLAGTVMLVASIFIAPSIDRALLWGIPSTLIVFGAIHTRQLAANILIQLGNASYSIYLIQIFTIPVFYKLISEAHLNRSHSDLYALLCLALTGIVGYLFYELYERKLTILIKSKIQL